MVLRIMERALDPGLYIVATPIGNLGDMTSRAIETLKLVNSVACEDSRVTGRLLHHFGIEARMIPYHDHSDDRTRARILAAAREGAVALVSDAGTPLISDPGYRLVAEAHAQGVAVRSVPGASALAAALSIAGLPTDRFLFAGFLPARAAARERELVELAAIPASLVFYETAPRLAVSLSAMAALLGDRPAAVARELTKRFECVERGTLGELAARFAHAPTRGEIVVVTGPPAPPPPPDATDVEAALRDALGRLSPARAASEVARATGQDRRTLYARAVALAGARDGSDA